MRRLSSRWTWWHKKGFPICWFGLLTLMTFAISWSVVDQHGPFAAPLVPIGMMIFGYILLSHLVWPLLDQVYLAEDSLIIRKDKDEEVIPLSNILEVAPSSMVNPYRITLRLHEPCRFGQEIAFCPLGHWRRGHVVADELAARTKEARDRVNPPPSSAQSAGRAGA